MKKAYPYLFLAIFLCMTWIVIPWYTNNVSGVKSLVQRIEKDFSGIVIKKYAPRDTPPTHLKIQTERKVLEMSFTANIIDSAEIGDSIFKYKDDNYVYLIKRENGDIIKDYYRRISNKTRQSKYFPKEWKGRWPESSAWDNKNIE